MEPLFTFRLPMHPKPKGSVRARAIKVDGNWIATTYPDPDSNKWEADAARLIAHAWGDRPPIDQAVVLRITAVFPRTKTQRKPRFPAGRLLMPVKPDLSNLLKATEDAVVKAGVLIDDGRVTDQHNRKRRAARGEKPCVEIELWATDGSDLAYPQLPAEQLGLL